MENILTQENFNRILTWLTDDETDMPDNAMIFLQNLTTAYGFRQSFPERKRNVRVPPGLTLNSIKLELCKEETDKMMKTDPEPKTMKPENKQDVQDNTPRETSSHETANVPADSVDVCEAIDRYAKMIGKTFSKSKTLMLLYIIYGVWLAEKGSSPFLDKPQMWKYGPVFPRAYTKSRFTEDSGKKALDKLFSENKDLYAFILRTVRLNTGTNAANLTQKHTSKGTPWYQCNTANPEKWSTTLDDEKIRLWFRTELDRQKNDIINNKYR